MRLMLLDESVDKEKLKVTKPTGWLEKWKWKSGKGAGAF
jgi:hypothetical protein